MHGGQKGSRGRRSWTRMLLVALLAVTGILSASSARANGPGETTEGYLLVQQALGHLAHDTSPDGVMLAMEKVDDALKTADQAGVNVTEVRQAKDALAAGQVEQARTLLQSSITQALAQLKPATGEETGTKVVLSTLPGRGDLAPGDLALLVGMVLLVLLGGALTWRFRPHDTIRDLQGRLGRSARTEPATSSPQPTLAATKTRDAS